MLTWSAKGGPDGEHTSCDEGCRRDNYCSTVNSYKDDRSLCS